MRHFNHRGDGYPRHVPPGPLPAGTIRPKMPANRESGGEAVTAAGPGRVSIENDVVFGTGGGRELKLDVYTPPEGLSNRAGVLLIHGGAWSGGDRSQLRGFGILLGRVGYTCVCCEYRLSGEAKWPAQLHDVKAALRWMRANGGRLGIEPGLIAVSGNSAGGHLSLMLAATPDNPELEGQGGNPGAGTGVAACIAIYPPTVLVKSPTPAGPVSALVGPSAPDDAYSAASPITYVRAEFPPTMLLHGNQDQVVPVEASLRMYQELSKAGAPVEMHIFNGQPHAFDAAPDYGRMCASLMDLFLKRNMLDIAPAAAGATANA